MEKTSGDCSKQNILELAAQAIYHDKAREHGEANDVFYKISRLWGSYLQSPLEMRDVAIMMALLKIARIRFRPCNMDNWLDAIGYLALGWEMASVQSSVGKDGEGE